jgi:hypothetical protein
MPIVCNKRDGQVSGRRATAQTVLSFIGLNMADGVAVDAPTTSRRLLGR